jgi:hypothetical protein
VAKETVTASWSPAHLNFADNFAIFLAQLTLAAHAFSGIDPNCFASACGANVIQI